jgi:hypothetical protein
LSRIPNARSNVCVCLICPLERIGKLAQVAGVGVMRMIQRLGLSITQDQRDENQDGADDDQRHAKRNFISLHLH